MNKGIALLVTMMVLAAAMFGQALTSLTGTVVDPSGALVPGASINIQNIATHATRETVSDGSGRYSLLQVQPGTYTVTAKAAGLADVMVNRVELLVSTPATLTIAFEKIGTVNEVVSVSAETAQVNTTDASLGNAISGKAITQLPFDGRNVVGLLSLQPGVTFLGELPTGLRPDGATRPDHRTGAVNGGKADQANVTLDGVDVNDQQDHTPFTSVLRVTLDSVEEFRTVTTNASADLGRSSGAQVALVTKSGTNALHGSAYEFNRNTSLAANDFFNNLSGLPRDKLIRNVFGASGGGPIKKDRLFYFLNYEGRRDRSESTGLRVVPTDNFRNGFFKYTRTDGSIGQLTPDQVKQLDPRHIGADPAILQLFQSYPLPNDFTQGDTLNTAGYRFHAPTPLRWNTYIAKFDYQLDQNGKHRIFWRGNLQNDNFANGIPEFPGEPASSVFLENSKGYAIGYTALLHPNLTSSFRYGYTRQGQEYTGILNASYAWLRDIDTINSTSTGLTRITPVHQLSEDLGWAKGAHNLTFGGVVRLINNNRLDFGHSYSNIEANSSVLVDGGLSLLAPDAENSTVYKRQFVNLLGLLTQANAQYNYDIQGNTLAQGAGIKRNFADQEYEAYVQDSWKVTRGLTITAGLRASITPPVYESSGAQTSTNIALGDWFNERGVLAANGQSQAQAPKISYQLKNSAGGHGLYPTQKDFSPRLAVAYSPQSNDGLSRWLFGGPGRTSIRAGAGVFYDLFGQGLIRDYDATALGFSTQLTPPASPLNPLSVAATAPRYTGYNDIPPSALPPAPKGGFPQTYPDILGVTNSIDEKLRSPYTINMNFSIGREFSHGLFIQGSYVGRLSRHSLTKTDVAMPTNLRDTKSGQTWFQAAQAMSKLARANTDTSKVQPIPFFENLFPGYAVPGQTATQFIYENYFVPTLYNETTASQFLDDIGSGCSPCSILGPNAMYSSQFAGLSAMRSIGTGSYHAMQWTVRKRFSDNLQFDFNYTWSKSIDLGSYGDAANADPNGAFRGLIQNAWFPAQMKAVSDYDATHLFSAFMVADLPFGKNKRYFSSASRFADALIGGWQVSTIWRQSSGLPAGVDDGGNWPTDWQIAPYATQIAAVPGQKTTKNAAPATSSGTSGPNIFANPPSALAAYDFTLPGESGQRNGIRGDGFFTIDVGLAKRFTLFSLKDHPHTLQIRAEAFNISNTVRFDTNTINLGLGDPANFGKYTSVLTNPRVIQLSARYEF
jgi:hypothetical protein